MTEAATPAEKRRALLRICFAFAKIGLAIYVGLLAALYFCQRQLEYVPVTISAGTPKEHGVPEMSVVTVTTPDNLSLAGWFAPPRAGNDKVVVMFHGQGIHIGYDAYKARPLLQRGYGVFLVEYRGFAGNPGSPTEDGLYNDARGVMAWLKQGGYDPSKIFLYGESLGTGVAVEMGTEFHVAGVILEGPYSSALEIAQYRYPYFPVSFLMHDPLDSVSKIGRMLSPLLIVHGALDWVIPIQYAHKLFDAAKSPKVFAVIKGAGHPPDLYNHGAGEIILDWLDKQIAAAR